MKFRAKTRKPGRRARRAVCEDVRFAEVEIERPPRPVLVVEIDGGLKLLIEEASVVDLAAEFVAALRAHEEGGKR